MNSVIIKRNLHIKNIGRKSKKNSSGDLMIFELDKKVLLYWRFTAAVLFAAVFSALWLTVPLAFVFKILASVVLCAVFIVYCFAYLSKRFSSENIEVTSNQTICRKGVILKREYIYPNGRLVYVQKVRLPLAQCFGLFSVVFRGAGHSLILPPLTHEQMILLLKAVQDGE